MLKPPTPREALLSAADEIIVQPFTPESAIELEEARRGNPVVRDAGAAAPFLYPGATGAPASARGKKGRSWKADPEALALYDGREALLVRTAIIRQPGYDKVPPTYIFGPSSVRELLAHLAFADQEHFVVLSLDSKNRVLSIFEASIGSASQTTVNVRDMVKTLILSGGVAAIIAHNHPSGSSNPSPEDLRVTEKIAGACDCLGYGLLDHVIVAHDGFYSMKEKGGL